MDEMKLFDPFWNRTPDRKHATDPCTPPARWSLLRPRTRGRVGAAAIALLAMHADPRGELGTLAHRLWEMVREDGEVAADFFRLRLDIPSPVELLTDVLSKLFTAGDVLATLLEHQARLEDRIAELEQVHGLSDAAVRTIRARSARDCDRVQREFAARERQQ